MYEKNLTEDFRLRLSSNDMEFLKNLAEKRSQSVSECVRSIIGEYRRSLDTLEILSQAIQLTKEKGVELSNGDTNTNINN